MIRLLKGDKKKKSTSTQSVSLWKKYNLKWVITITIWTFFLAIGISVSSETVLNNSETYFSFIILFTIISIGVLADIIGIAVTVASEKPFHAMAADKVEGSKYAIKLLKNAGPVSNFCNDVIGDICGILSGVASASIIINLKILPFLLSKPLITTILSGLVAAITVGGKAIGKGIAINNAHKIVFYTARVINFINKKINIGSIKLIKGKR